MKVVLDGSSLTIDDACAVARGGASVALSSDALARMSETRSVVLQASERGEVVYGLTTGVAERKRVSIAARDHGRYNHLLIDAHRIAQGPLATPAVVRCAMACLANSYAKGAAGVRPELAQMIVDTLNDGFAPPVRSLGSVGESDLGPMADLADGLLSRSGFALEQGEGLALINSSAFATGWATLALDAAYQLMDGTDVAAALDFEAFAANGSCLHPAVGELRASEGIRSTVRSLRELLDGSVILQSGAARNLQDPLTFRCVPQIHGAARDTFGYAAGVVTRELNASQGNPAVVLQERRVVSVGNFDVLAMAAALDFARIALAPVVTSAAERSVKLLQGPMSGLTAGLAQTPEAGEDALAELAVTSQSLAVEARLLAQPVSFELASTSKAEGIEDRTTMAPLSARRLSEMVELTTRVIAVAIVVSAQAVELRGLDRLGARTAAAHKLVRAHVPFVGEGEALPADLEPLVESVRRGALADVARRAA